jgi:Protein of unknown function (DUF1761)
MIGHINFLSVAVAALATFLIGGPWYSPAMFLKVWMREMGQKDAQPGHPVRVFGLAYAFSFVACGFLASLLGSTSSAVDGLQTGALIGLCFVAASFGVNYQFANRSFKALLIDGGYHVLQFAAFGLILGAWPK